MAIGLTLTAFGMMLPALTPANAATVLTASPHIADAAPVAPAAGQCTSADPCNLRQAIADANAATGNSTIQLLQGTYALDPLQGPLDANATTGTTETIEGNSPATAVINGEQSNGVIQIGGGTNAGAVTLENVEITGGAATAAPGFGAGGGIFSYPDTTLNLTDSVVTGNTATIAAGGIDAQGQTTIIGSTISGNSVIGGAGTTIGIAGGIAANSTDGSNATPNAPISIENSTITGNDVPSSCGSGCTPAGAGIYNEPGNKLTLANVTVAGNAIGNGGVDGGGVTNGSTTPDLAFYNTIIAQNGGGDCGIAVTGEAFTPPSDFGGNVADDATCALNNGHSLPSTDPKLVQSVGAPLLTDNGGPTPTIAFQTGVINPATHAGYQACASTDQRGAPRPGPAGGPCSSGAVESYGRYTITGSLGSGSGSSTVTAAETHSNPAASCTGGTCVVDQGSYVQLTASPAAGYRFTGWTSATCTVSGTTCTFNNVSANGSATANFTARFTVTGGVIGAGGTVAVADLTSPGSCSSGSSCTVDLGDTVTLTANPSDPALVPTWTTGPCASTPAVNPCTITHVGADQTDGVSFALAAPGDGSNAVFVAPPPLGDDHNPGTEAQPVATVRQATQLVANSSSAKTQIRVAKGIYPGGLAMTTAAGNTDSGVGIYGGFDSGTWQQALNDPSATTINGAGDGVLLDGATNITFQDLTISATVGSANGLSVYGLRAIGQSSFTLEDVAVNVGNAAAGASGSPGAIGEAGGKGGDGGNGTTPLDVASNFFITNGGGPGLPGLGANGNLSGMLVNEYVCYPAPGSCDYPSGTLTLTPSGGDGGWGGTGVDKSITTACQLLGGLDVCGVAGIVQCTYGVDEGCNQFGQKTGVIQPEAGQPGSPSLDYTPGRVDDYIKAGGTGGLPGPYAANDLGEIAKPGANGQDGATGPAGADGANETTGGSSLGTAYTVGAGAGGTGGEAGSGGGGGGGGSGQDNGLANGGGDGGGSGGGGGGPGTAGTAGQGGGGAFGLFVDHGSTGKLEFGSAITVGNGGNGGNGGSGGAGGAGGQGGSGNTYAAGTIGAGGNGGSGGSGGGGGGGGGGIGGPSVGIETVDGFSTVQQSSDTAITTGSSGVGGLSGAAGGSTRAPSAVTERCSTNCSVVAALPVQLPAFAVVTGFIATLTIECSSSCRGTVLLTTIAVSHGRGRRATRIARVDHVVLGDLAFTLAARHRRALHITINAAGRKRLRGVKHLVAELTVHLKLAGHRLKTYTQQIVLTHTRPPKGKQKLRKQPPDKPRV